jgi:eukaryotic-like serine/threonine-protein kinase
MGEGNFSDGSPPRDAATIPEQHLADECQTVSTLLPDKPSDEPTIPRANVEPPSAQPERTLPKVDGYEILGELGRGGMGVVYRAREILLNRPCVLKMILAGAHADAESIVRFLAEAESVARLQHPNVVQIHRIGEADGLPFFELEYVDGGSLDQRLDGTPWKARAAAELAEAVSRAISEAHRLGIVHRDLKPANILMTAHGVPKVADFGLAKSLTRDSGLTRSNSIMGSPGYMSPEQAEGRTKQVGPLADVYALGAILYELVTGRPPFVGASVLETLEQVRSSEPLPPCRLVPPLPRDVETIVLKCLQKEPGKRYDSASALADDLRRFLSGESILARPVSPIERSWRWCRRNPVVASLAAALTAILVLATAASLVAYERMSRLARGEHEARLTAVREMKATEEARVQEAAQRQRAQANFHRARAAVDGYLTAVSESQLLKISGLQPLRGQLLESALRFYQDFLKERGDDPELRAELAATQARIGRIQEELGAADEARRALKAAIAAYQQEISQSPRDVPLRTALSDTWLALGDLTYNFGGNDASREMVAAWEKAAELREGLARDRPDDRDCQRNLAEACDRLASGQDGAGRDGMPARLRGAELRLALFQKFPDDPKINFGLAESINNIAVALTNAGHNEDALAMHLRGKEYNRFAYEKQPHMIDFCCDFATTSMNVVRVYRNLGRKKDAVTEAQNAVELCRRMVRDHPAALLVKRQFVWALELLVESQRDAGPAAEAAHTARELAQWLDVVVDEPQWMFDSARWHTRLSIWSDEWKNLPADQAHDEARREADRAVEQLQRAIDSGFAELDQLRKDTALDPLRARADFQKLVAKLEQRLRPRPKSSVVEASSGDTPKALPDSRAERIAQSRADRAAVLYAAGVLEHVRKRPQEARAALVEARSACEQLLQARPSDARIQTLLAGIHRALGGLD